MINLEINVGNSGLHSTCFSNYDLVEWGELDSYFNFLDNYLIFYRYVDNGYLVYDIVLERVFNIL